VNDAARTLAARIVAASSGHGPPPPGGARLPAERELAAEFGVARSAIRHAMAVLEAEGRITREVGRGTFLVASATSAAEADYSPADVMLVRRMFEPHAMPLVVAWATARDLAEMDRCLQGGKLAADYSEFESWDSALHRAIIAAAHSPLLSRLYADVDLARHSRQWGDLKRRTSSVARRAEYQADHENIVAVLRQRDAAAATLAMAEHLDRVARYLLGS